MTFLKITMQEWEGEVNAVSVSALLLTVCT